MKPWELIRKLEGISSKKMKEDLINGLSDDSEFWPGCMLVFDVTKSFGIKNLPIVQPYAGNEIDLWPRFKSLTDDMITRKLVGHRAKKAIEDFAQNCSAEQWKFWYLRILQKDLKCGVGQAMISKLSPSNHNFIPFNVQLARLVREVPPERMFRRAHLEAKYDGVRTVWFIKRSVGVDLYFDDEHTSHLDYDVRCFSRNGKEIHNFGHISSQLALITRSDEFPDCGLVIDGEVISETFDKMTNQLHHNEFTDLVSDAYLVAFDAMTVDQFNKRLVTAPFDARRSLLEKLINDLYGRLRDIDPLVFTSVIMKNIDPISQHDIVERFLYEQMSNRFEGIIIKDADAPYEWDRTSRMLKMKQTISVDLDVIDFVPGKGKFADTLGSIECQGFSDDGTFINVNISTGMSDEIRRSIWKIGLEKMKGRKIEIIADALTKNRDGTISLQYPRFKRFRDDLN